MRHRPKAESDFTRDKNVCIVKQVNVPPGQRTVFLSDRRSKIYRKERQVYRAQTEGKIDRHAGEETDSMLVSWNEHIQKC